MADRMVLPTDLYPVAPGDAPERHPDQLQLLAYIVQHLYNADRNSVLRSRANKTYYFSQPPQPILTELRVDDASTTLYKLIVTTTMWSTSTP
jgi:hypothetical protein